MITFYKETGEFKNTKRVCQCLTKHPHIYWNYVTKTGEVVHLYVVIRERENGMRDHMFLLTRGGMLSLEATNKCLEIS